MSSQKIGSIIVANTTEVLRSNNSLVQLQLVTSDFMRLSCFFLISCDEKVVSPLWYDFQSP